MFDAELNELFKDADMSNFPNHISLNGDSFDSNVFSNEYWGYRRKWIENARNFHVGDFPLHLDIEVTNSCNIRCKMCFVDFSIDKGKFMDLDLFRKIIDEGSRHGLCSVKYNYRGEPMLHRDLVEMVEYTKQNGVLEAQFNTNGTLLTRGKSEQLIEAGLDKIIVSLEGTSAETYNRIRVGADYDAVVDNILSFLDIRKALNAKKPLLRVQMVCMKENQQEVGAFVKLWKKTADQIGLIRFRKQREEQEDQRIVDYDQFVKPCHQLYQRMVIGCDGKVTMCCGDMSRLVVLGDAHKTPIAQLWKSEKLQRIRKLHEEERSNEVPPCKTCSINRHNKGKEWEWLSDLNEGDFWYDILTKMEVGLQ